VRRGSSRALRTSAPAAAASIGHDVGRRVRNVDEAPYPHIQRVYRVPEPGLDTASRPRRYGGAREASE
jgi:hypothetical protein